MAKFRKKPIVIEAFQWYGDYIDGFQVLESNPPQLVVHTLEGDMYARPGDWIITGIMGEIYPCKPDIFKATYEPAEIPLVTEVANTYSLTIAHGDVSSIKVDFEIMKAMGNG